MIDFIRSLWARLSGQGSGGGAIVTLEGGRYEVGDTFEITCHGSGGGGGIGVEAPPGTRSNLGVMGAEFVSPMSESALRAARTAGNVTT